MNRTYPTQLMISSPFRVRITISCRMSFDQYPLDAHTCQFQVGSCECKITCHRGKCQKKGFTDISFSRLRYQQNGQMQLPVHLRQSSPEESSALHHFWATERGTHNSGSAFRCRHIVMLSFSYCAVFAGGYSIFRPLLFPKYVLPYWLDLIYLSLR